MKKILPIALAAVLAAIPFGAAQAQPYPAPGYGHPPGPPPGFHPLPPGFRPPPPGFRPGRPPWGGPAPAGWRRWNRGDRFYGPRYVIDNWGAYALPRPYPGYFWARSGGEFVMINTGSGIVGSVVISPGYP